MTEEQQSDPQGPSDAPDQSETDFNPQPDPPGAVDEEEAGEGEGEALVIEY